MNCRFSILRKAGLLLVFLVIAVDFGQAVAGGLEDALRRGKLLVGVRTDSPPFGYLDNSGATQGFDVEIAQYLARALFSGEERRLELVPVTPGSRIPYLYSELVDVIIASMSITEDRKKLLEFSMPYFMSGTLLLVRKDSRVKGLEDLSGKNVGIIWGSVQEEDLRLVEGASNAKLVRFSSIDEAVQALKDRNIDVFRHDDVVIRWLLKGNPELQEAGSPFDLRPYAAAVRKGDLEFVNWINAQFEKAKQDGTYERLLQKYFGAP